MRLNIFSCSYFDKCVHDSSNNKVWTYSFPKGLCHNKQRKRPIEIEAYNNVMFYWPENWLGRDSYFRIFHFRECKVGKLSIWDKKAWLASLEETSIQGNTTEVCNLVGNTQHHTPVDAILSEGRAGMVYFWNGSAVWCGLEFCAVNELPLINCVIAIFFCIG